MAPDAEEDDLDPVEFAALLEMSAIAGWVLVVGIEAVDPDTNESLISVISRPGQPMFVTSGLLHDGLVG